MDNAKLLCLFHTLLVCNPLVQSARILGIFPFHARSHHRFYQPLMKTLARAGHEVVVYSPFPLDNAHPNYTDVYLEHMPSSKENNLIENVRYGMSRPWWQCIDGFWHVKNHYFQDVIEDPKIQQLISSDENFDLVITETFMAQDHSVIFGCLFKAPIIAIQSFTTNQIVNSQFGNTLAMSYIPDLCAPFTNKLTFLQRLMNSFATLRALYLTYYNTYLPELQTLIRERFPDMPPLDEMIKNISLVFVNDHWTADYARPRPPNIIPVAGIHIEPKKPLPQIIKTFMDNATEGVILFSLGTYVPDELQPKEYFDMYINVFKNLPQRVLWKTRKDNIEGLPNNVMRIKWAPQPDILAHPNCVLFITHGGLLSQHEAIFFGVPVVGVPQFADQPRNVAYYEAQEVGVKVDASDLSENTMSDTINTVLSNSRYRKNMKRLSMIFRDRPLSPAETVVFWTEYVLRHGGAGHLKPASVHLSWYQIALLDVLLAITSLLIVIVCALHLVVKRILCVAKRKIQNCDENTKKTN